MLTLFSVFYSIPCMEYEIEESEWKCFVHCWLSQIMHIDHSQFSAQVNVSQVWKVKPKGTVVNGERKSHLAANSYKPWPFQTTLPIPVIIFRKTENNMEYVYIVRKCELHQSMKMATFIERKIFKVSVQTGGDQYHPLTLVSLPLGDHENFSG